MKLNSPHRRLNLLTNRWVLVSPQRSQRPWLGQVEKTQAESLPSYDPDCYLCPGNPRAGGHLNPDYQGTFVFDNDFPALLPIPENAKSDRNYSGPSSMMAAEQEYGICRVICFSPRHDLTLPELSNAEIASVIHTWIDQTKEMLDVDFIQYVQVFENKGALMGCSNPHPHSQIWALSQVPDEVATESETQKVYWETHNSCLLCDYLDEEIRVSDERVVEENDHFIALVPFWATWPFEILLISRRHLMHLPDLNVSEVLSLADILKKITTRYDNLFKTSFPYSMGFHQSPKHVEPQSSWHFHAHFYPPLLRSATVKKFMVGFEMLAMPQRDITPESAASLLREMSTVHYKSQ